jgi:hypothetical protein
LNNEFVEGLRVDDMCKASRAEVTTMAVDSYAIHVDVGFHCCETNVAEPMRDKVNTYRRREDIPAHHCSLIMSRKSL